MRSGTTRRPAAGALVALAAGAVLAGAAVVPLVTAPGAAVATSASSAGDCSVSGATLTWGVKESFRSYISGAIAKGSWEVSGGATYETPSFGWSAGSGPLADGLGDIAFAGAIRFTGHQGVLDTTLADPVLRLTGPSSAELLLDVSGTTQEGQAVASTDVRFATVDLSAAPVDASGDAATVTIADAPVALTDEGAAAFGTYPAGTALDPLTAVLPVACAAVAAPTPTPTLTPDDEPSEDPASSGAEAAGSGDEATSASSAVESGGADDAGPGLAAGVAGIGAVLVAAAAAAAVLVRRRRATAATAAAMDGAPETDDPSPAAGSSASPGTEPLRTEPPRPEESP